MIHMDLSDVIGSAEKAKSKLISSTKDIMLSSVRIAAMDERATHAYRNRSNKLEKNTKGVLERSGIRETRVALVMDRSYASYVRARGLTQIDSYALQAEKQMEALFNTIDLD